MAKKTARSGRGEQYREFFRQLIDVLIREHQFSIPASKKRTTDNDIDFSIGIPGLGRVVYDVGFRQGGEAKVGFYINGKSKEWNEALFDDLKEHKREIEGKLGRSVSWERMDHRKACRILLLRDGSIEDDPETLAEIREWMIKWLLEVRRVFIPILKELA